VEAVAVGVVGAGGDPGRQREDRAVAPVLPGLGEAEGEDEDVQRLEHGTDSGEMCFAVGLELLRRDKPARLRCRTEGVKENVRRFLPDILGRLELAEGSLEELPQLPGSVDVPIARREEAVVMLGSNRSRNNRMPWLGHVIVVA